MKINAAKVARIKADIAGSMTQAAIAKKYKVSRSTVSDIATGRIHKEVPWPNGEPVPKKSGGQRKKIADHDPTNKRILELEAEVIHLTDERNRERVKNKASAKTQGLFRAISLEMAERIKPFKALPSQIESDRKAQIVEHCVMHL